MKTYDKALEFWNGFYAKYNESAEDGDDGQLGSTVLEQNFEKIAPNADVLDFGCGLGWASEYIARHGARSVTAVDQSINAINYCVEHANKLNLKINYVLSRNFLERSSGNQFDSIFSSNVLDVVPEAVSEQFLTDFCKVLKEKGSLLLMINPYLSTQLAEQVNMKQVGKTNAYTKDGILRAVNLTSQQWMQRLSKYFADVTYSEFVFPDEDVSRQRRLFLCRQPKK